MPITRKPGQRTATISLPKWPDDIVRKFNLKRYDFKPILPKGKAASLKGDKKKKKKAEYITEAIPGYQIQHEINGDAIGFDEKGRLMFVFLKGVISERVRDRTLVGLRKMEFRSCNKSGRPELREAIRFNGHTNPEAGEINTGYMHLAREFKIKQSARNERRLQFILPLLRAMDGRYQKVLPRQFGEQNRKIKAHHRHGFSPFSTLTFLRSAPSAVHVDARNGAGALACMTTIKPPSGSKGGEFCFVEYGVQIGVTPGDLLIAATPKHWHCNLSPVVGTKYSIICYFKDALRKKPLTVPLPPPPVT